MFSQSFFCCVFLYLSIVVDQSKCGTYRAILAEPEFHTSSLETKERIIENVQSYIMMMHSAAKENARIVIFPESLLNDPHNPNTTENVEHAIAIPEPDDKTSLCNLSAKINGILNAISCEAKTLKLFVALHLLEKSACENNCSTDGYNLHRSNVIFDDAGRLVMRTRRVIATDEIEGKNFPDVDYKYAFANLLRSQSESAEIDSQSMTIRLQKPATEEEMVESTSYARYFCDKVQIPLFLAALYCLEMM